nr:hypothetical protein [Lachnospiraceae bacterium]
KTDLYDEKEYPDVILPNGNVIRTVYTSAIVRIADEIDVASDRNPELLFDTSQLTEERDIVAFGTHKAIRWVDVFKDRIVLNSLPQDDMYREKVEDIAVKIQETLDYCKDVVRKRCDIPFTQEKVEIEYISDEMRQPISKA